MNNLKLIVELIRSHGLQAMAVNGIVYFECSDGIRHTVRSMGEAREFLGY